MEFQEQLLNYLLILELEPPVLLRKMLHFLLQLACVSLSNKLTASGAYMKQGKGKEGGRKASGRTCLFPSPGSGRRLAILHHSFLAGVDGDSVSDALGVGVGSCGGVGGGGAGGEDVVEGEGFGREGEGVRRVSAEAAETDLLPHLLHRGPALGGRGDGGGPRGGGFTDLSHGNWQQGRWSRRGLALLATKPFVVKKSSRSSRFFWGEPFAGFTGQTYIALSIHG